MIEELQNFTYSDLFYIYNILYPHLNGKNYYTMLKEEIGLNVSFENDTINLVSVDETKYFLSKLKYGI